MFNFVVDLQCWISSLYIFSKHHFSHCIFTTQMFQRAAKQHFLREQNVPGIRRFSWFTFSSLFKIFSSMGSRDFWAPISISECLTLNFAKLQKSLLIFEFFEHFAALFTHLVPVHTFIPKLTHLGVAEKVERSWYFRWNCYGRNLQAL